MTLVSRLVGVGIQSVQARHLGFDTDSSLTPTGNDNQGDAAQVEANINAVLNVTASANSVRLMEYEQCPAGFVLINNQDASDTLNVFPAVGERINWTVANTKITVAAGETAFLYLMKDGPSSAYSWLGVVI